MRYLIVHHSVTGHNVSLSTIKSWGYNKVIRWSGEVVNAKGDAHTYGHNYDGLGVCLIGNFEKEKPNQAQIDSLIRVLKEWKRKYPKARIVGHKDLRNNPPGHNFTLCPGKYLYAMLPEIRNKVETNQNMDEKEIIRKYETDPKTLRFRDNANKDIFIFRLADNQDLSAKTLDYYTINPDILVSEVKAMKKAITNFKVELRETNELLKKREGEYKTLKREYDKLVVRYQTLEKKLSEAEINAKNMPQLTRKEKLLKTLTNLWKKAVYYFNKLMKLLSY